VNVDAEKRQLLGWLTPARAPSGALRRAGTVRKFTLPAGPVRAGWKEGAYSWWVAGNTVYRVDAAFAILAIGTLGTTTGGRHVSSEHC
jgi:hypothetical protein